MFYIRVQLVTIRFYCPLRVFLQYLMGTELTQQVWNKSIKGISFTTPACLWCKQKIICICYVINKDILLANYPYNRTIVL